MKPAVLIVNSRSRRGLEWFESAREELLANSFDLKATVMSRHMEEIHAAVAEAISQNIPTIAVGGGDGTLNAVVDHFVGQRSALGVLPLGTGNAFARDLGIPSDVRQACQVIASGCTAPIDLGFANGTHFVNVATVGLSTKIAKTLTVPMKRRFGRMVYAIGVSRAILTQGPFRAQLETENGITAFESLQIVIGNGRYHAGPFPVSPEASITEGMLTVYALRSARRSSLLRYLLNLPGGQHVHLDEVHHEETRGGILRTYPPQDVTIDGEVSPKTPLHFRIVPQALNVHVSATFAG